MVLVIIDRADLLVILKEAEQNIECYGCFNEELDEVCKKIRKETGLKNE